MRRSVIRALTGIVIVLAAGYAGSTYTHFEPEVREVRAQDLVPTPDPATATPTATATEAPTPIPTEVASSPTATSDIGPPSPTSTAATDAPSPTATATAIASPIAVSTPLPVPALPAISEDPAADDAVTQQIIGSDGGTVVSSGGRAALTFGPGAVSSDTKITISHPADTSIAYLPDHRFVGLWQFEANTVSTNAELHTFGVAPTLTLRFGKNELFGVAPETLKLWSWDGVARSWQEVPGIVLDHELRVSLPHFSTFGATADPQVNLAPLTDIYDTNLQSGSASVSIPIEVPAGPAGLSPLLALNYDSGGPNEMRDSYSQGSWAGIGWDLETGSITVSADPAQDLTMARTNLSLPGVAGGELVLSKTSTTPTYGNPWRLRKGDYLRVNWSGGDPLNTNRDPGLNRDLQPQFCGLNYNCTWTVTDKSGTIYVFGAATYYRDYIGTSPNSRTIVRFHLTKVTDTLGNEMRIEYDQVTYARDAGTQGRGIPPTRSRRRSSGRSGAPTPTRLPTTW